MQGKEFNSFLSANGSQGLSPVCCKRQGCPGEKTLCRQFLSLFKFFGFKEWNLSVAKRCCTQPHLFFISHSSSGTKEREDDLGEAEGQ